MLLLFVGTKNKRLLRVGAGGVGSGSLTISNFLCISAMYPANNEPASLIQLTLLASTATKLRLSASRSITFIMAAYLLRASGVPSFSTSSASNTAFCNSYK